KRVELIDHRIDGLLKPQNLTTDIDGDFLRQIALGNSGRYFRNIAHLTRQVAGHRIDAVRQILPGSGDAADHRLPTKLAFGTDLARHARHFTREGVELIDHRIDGFLELEHLAAHIDGNLLRQISVGDDRRIVVYVENVV